MKELIYFHSNMLQPKGGPAGYLYNLNREFEKCNIDCIDFLPEKKITYKDKIKKIVVKFPSVYKIIHYFAQKNYGNSILNMIFNSKEYKAEVDLSCYDIVHFHSTLDMYMCKDSLEKFSGKVLLTSHSPKVYHKELMDDFAESTKKSRKSQIDNIDIIDSYAFERADYVIFPVPEAMECYENTWDKFSGMFYRFGVIDVPDEVKRKTGNIRR